MGAVALRRTKEQQVGGRPLVNLPAKHVHAVSVQLDVASRAKYERWQAAGGAPVAAGWLGAGCGRPATASWTG